MILDRMGQFCARDNLHPCKRSYHPLSFAKVPRPKALAAGTQTKREATNEVAVMIDSRDALEVSDLPDDVEWHGYVDSWTDSSKEEDK